MRQDSGTYLSIQPFKDLRDEVTDILREKVPEAEAEDHENKESIPAKE